MTAWWTSRTTRERALLALMGAGLFAFLLWYGLYAPALSARTAAVERYQAAVRAQTEVTGAVARIKALQPRAPRASGAAPEEALRQTAESAGMTLARLEPDPEGGLRVAADGTPATTLFPWLAQLQREHGLVARNLTILKDDGGGLRLDATFVRAVP